MGDETMEHQDEQSPLDEAFPHRPSCRQSTLLLDVNHFVTRCVEKAPRVSTQGAIVVSAPRFGQVFARDRSASWTQRALDGAAEEFFNRQFSSATLNGLAAFPNLCFVTAKPADRRLTT